MLLGAVPVPVGPGVVGVGVGSGVGVGVGVGPGVGLVPVPCSAMPSVGTTVIAPPVRSHTAKPCPSEDVATLFSSKKPNSLPPRAIGTDGVQVAPSVEEEKRSSVSP